MLRAERWGASKPNTLGSELVLLVVKGARGTHLGLWCTICGALAPVPWIDLGVSCATPLLADLPLRVSGRVDTRGLLDDLGRVVREDLDVTGLSLLWPSLAWDVHRLPVPRRRVGLRALVELRGGCDPVGEGLAARVCLGGRLAVVVAGVGQWGFRGAKDSLLDVREDVNSGRLARCLVREVGHARLLEKCVVPHTGVVVVVCGDGARDGAGASGGRGSRGTGSSGAVVVSYGRGCRTYAVTRGATRVAADDDSETDDGRTKGLRHPMRPKLGSVVSESKDSLLADGAAVLAVRVRVGVGGCGRSGEWKSRRGGEGLSVGGCLVGLLAREHLLNTSEETRLV